MRRTSWIILIISTTPRSTLGQTTNTTCASTSTTSWLFNSNGDSPCLVWSRIQSLCLSSTQYVNVPPLPDSSWSYGIPSGETACQCNVVSYALMAGCTWCQFAEAGNWAAEEQWKQVCGERYTPDGLGFAESVEPVPAYAWKPWNGRRWSPADASSSATLYNTATPTGSTTLSRSFPSTPSLTSTTSPVSTSTDPTRPSDSSTPSTPPPPEEQSTAEKWGPIVGGIAGGVIALVLLALLIRYCLARRRKGAAADTTAPIIRYTDPERRARSRGASIMNLFGGYASPRGGRDRDRDLKRETELIADPLSFAMPRPAPKAPDHERGLMYTTTQQRLRNKPLSDSESESAVVVVMKPSRPLVVSNYPDDDVLSPEPRIRTSDKAMAFSPRPGTATATHDFSQPRPYSDTQTLPSLYEPPTGAPTSRGTKYSVMTDDTRPETLLSPASRYPVTQRDSGASMMIGAAMGSGRRVDGDYWSRQELPPIPRSVSDESEVRVGR